MLLRLKTFTKITIKETLIRELIFKNKEENMKLNIYFYFSYEKIYIFPLLCVNKYSRKKKGDKTRIYRREYNRILLVIFTF